MNSSEKTGSFTPAKLGSIFAILLPLLGLSACNQDTGIRYVDNARLFHEVSAFLAVRDSVEAYNKHWEEGAKPLKDSLDALMKNIGDNHAPMSDKQRQTLESEFRAKQDTLQHFVDGSQKKAAEIERTLTDGAVKKVNALLNKYREANNLRLVLGTTAQGSILSADPALDISDKVVKYLNEGLK